MINRWGREGLKNIKWQRKRFVSAALFILAGLVFSACLVSGRVAETEVSAPIATATEEEKGVFAGVSGVECIPQLNRYEIATLIEPFAGYLAEALT